ncbi:MAG: permease, partial [Arenicellales bacterium]
LEKLGFERFVKPIPVQETSGRCCGTSKPVSKWRKIWDEVWLDFKKALPYLFVGVLFGAIIHGFVPEEFITQYISDDNPVAIPLAAVIGIPLYVRAVVMIPLSAAFVAKGMGIGVVMAFVIGSAGASLPEVILLQSMFKRQMIIAFLFIVLSMAVLTGFVFSWIF